MRYSRTLVGSIDGLSLDNALDAVMLVRRAFVHLLLCLGIPAYQKF